MKKRLPIFMLLCILGLTTMACGLIGNDEEENSVKNPSQIAQGEKVKLAGMVYSYYENSLSFLLEDAGEQYTIFISGDLDIKNGEYIEVEGEWDKINNALVMERIKKLSEGEKTEYFQSRFPFLEISILEYPQTVSHTCYTPKFKFNLTNTGRETITHADLHNYDYEYAFYYFINDNWSRANADREDYTQVESDIKENELSLIGFLSNQGFMYFEDIGPGQSREVEYWAGGQVTKTPGGTAGSPNIFGNYPMGEQEFSFAWAKKNNYDPIFLSKTDSVKINMLSDQCDLGL